MALVQSTLRKKRTIRLTSGPEAVVQSLIGKHQRILTEQRKDVHDKLNEIIQDVLVSVNGVDFDDMQDYQKTKFIQKMLSSDRRLILGEARQLSRGKKSTFHYHHEWKTASGVKQTEVFEIALIDEDNRDEVIEMIVKRFGFESEEHLELIEQLNIAGSFPARPCRKLFDDYNDVLANCEIIFKDVPTLEQYEFSFTMLNGVMEKKLSKKSKTLHSHHGLLGRNLRYREIKEGEGEASSWRSVTSNDLDQLSTDALEFIREKIEYYEGDVDSTEIIDNPDPLDSETKLTIDLMNQVSFFFPSGRI